MTVVPHTLVNQKWRITKGSHTKAACRFRAAALLPFFFFGRGEGWFKKGGWPFFALVSRLGEGQDKDGKGERIRVEALVV